LSLFDDSLELVFYDVTSVYFEVRGDDDFRRYGYSRDHRRDRPQVVVGLVMTKEGLPVAHYTFPGNVPDKSTFSATIQDIRKRFGIQHCVVVADRGMVSEVNLEDLEEEGVGFLLSIQMKQNAAFQKKLGAMKSELEKKWIEKESEAGDVYYEGTLDGQRLVVAYNEKRALESRAIREKLLGEAEDEIFSWVEKLNRQDRGKRTRGRQLTDQGVLLKAHDFIKSKGVSAYFKVFLDSEGLFRCHVDRKRRNRAERLDGILAVITTDTTLSSEEVIRQYKGLQEVERCFRTLKSSLDIRPVYHWKERRIRAHIFLCVMALQVERVLKQRLRRGGSEESPEKALYKLSGIHALKAGEHVGLTTLKEEHRELYRQLEIPFPNVNSLSNPAV
jgi:transposase